MIYEGDDDDDDDNDKGFIMRPFQVRPAHHHGNVQYERVFIP